MRRRVSSISRSISSFSRFSRVLFTSSISSSDTSTTCSYSFLPKRSLASLRSRSIGLLSSSIALLSERAFSAPSSDDLAFSFRLFSIFSSSMPLTAVSSSTASARLSDASSSSALSRWSISSFTSISILCAITINSFASLESRTDSS